MDVYRGGGSRIVDTVCLARRHWAPFLNVAPLANAGRIEVVDYMRGVAALSVAWFHLTNGYRGSWVQASGAYGWLGVEVFFVISGFVIPHSLARANEAFGFRNFLPYVAKHIIRLEPPYLASIALVLGLWELSAMVPSFKGSAAPTEASQIAAHLFYLIPLTDYDWLQPIYWTLAYEFAFYVCMGLSFPLIGSRSQRPIWRIATIVILSAAALGVLPIYSLLFVMGFAIYRLMSCHDSGRTTAATVLAAAVTMAMKQAYLQGAVGLAAAGMIAVSSSVPRPAGIVARLLAGLGAISYSLYLIHLPIGGRIVNLGSRFIEGATQQLALAVLAMAVSLFAAVVFWRLVETPAIKAARHLPGGLNKSRPSAA